MPFPRVNLESRQKKRKAGQSRSEGLWEHRVSCGYPAAFVEPEPLLGPAWAVPFRFPRPTSAAMVLQELVTAGSPQEHAASLWGFWPLPPRGDSGDSDL